MKREYIFMVVIASASLACSTLFPSVDINPFAPATSIPTNTALPTNIPEVTTLRENVFWEALENKL